MNDKQLLESIKSCTVMMNDKPNNMTDEASEFFEQISTSAFDYDFRQSVINKLNDINLDTLRNMYHNSFVNSTRKVVVVRAT